MAALTWSGVLALRHACTQAPLRGVRGRAFRPAGGRGRSRAPPQSFDWRAWGPPLMPTRMAPSCATAGPNPPSEAGQISESPGGGRCAEHDRCADIQTATKARLSGPLEPIWASTDRRSTRFRLVWAGFWAAVSSGSRPRESSGTWHDAPDYVAPDPWPGFGHSGQTFRRTDVPTGQGPTKHGTRQQRQAAVEGGSYYKSSSDN